MRMQKNISKSVLLTTSVPNFIFSCVECTTLSSLVLNAQLEHCHIVRLSLSIEMVLVKSHPTAHNIVSLAQE